MILYIEELGSEENHADHDKSNEINLQDKDLATKILDSLY